MNKDKKSVSLAVAFGVMPGMASLVFLIKVVTGLSQQGALRSYYLNTDFNSDVAYLGLCTAITVAASLFGGYYGSKGKKEKEPA